MTMMMMRRRPIPPPMYISISTRQEQRAHAAPPRLGARTIDHLLFSTDSPYRRPNRVELQRPANASTLCECQRPPRNRAVRSNEGTWRSVANAT